jgi:hypothetical protein
MIGDTTGIHRSAKATGGANWLPPNDPLARSVSKKNTMMSGGTKRVPPLAAQHDHLLTEDNVFGLESGARFEFGPHDSRDLTRTSTIGLRVSQSGQPVTLDQVFGTDSRLNRNLPHTGPILR